MVQGPCESLEGDTHSIQNIRFNNISTHIQISANSGLLTIKNEIFTFGHSIIFVKHLAGTYSTSI